MKVPPTGLQGAWARCGVRKAVLEPHGGNFLQDNSGLGSPSLGYLSHVTNGFFSVVDTDLQS